MSSSEWETDSEFDPENCHVCGGKNGLLTGAPVWRIDEAAAKGCVACCLIKDIIQKYAPGIDAEEPVSIMRGSGVEEIMIGKDKGYPLRVKIYGHDDPSPIWEDYSKYENIKKVVTSELPDIIGDTSSRDALALIKRWIGECQTTHDDCHQEEKSRLPNRVLDLGDTEDNSIRLYQTHNEEAKYMCLSHCWGSSELLKTTTGTLSERLHRIEWEDLPKTFQDAVKMTRALGVRYLWIDSLCIIQDNKNDWRKESAQMDTIYQGGYLTLAASKGKDPSTGLFSVSGPEYKLCEWHVDSQKEVIRTRRKIHHFESSEEFPLLKRGWVFQERILSRRILHFGPRELIWECMRDYDCECSFIGSSFDVDHGLGHKRRYRPVKRFDHYGWLMFVWWKIVEDYSALNLTYDEDIFPALSGVARPHMAARDAKYFAGLWGNTFVHDLLWYIPNRLTVIGSESHYNRGLRPLKWRAPTWSWASVKSAVKYDHYMGFSDAIEIEKIDVKAVDGNTMGQLLAASLIVYGKLAGVTIHRKASGSHGADEYFKSPSKKEKLSVDFLKDYDIWAESGDRIEEGDDLYFLLAAKVFENQASNGKKDEIWFIVLRLVNDLPEGIEDTEDLVYARIGLATMEATAEDPPEFLGTFEYEDTIMII